MKASEFIFEDKITLRVRYGETDQMGYVYYGNYAQYFEVGRVEALRNLGISYKTMEEEGFMLPVSEYHVKYRFPAKYDDELTVKTFVVGLSGPRLLFEYEIFNEDKALVATAHTTLVFVNKTTMRPTAPPENFCKMIDNMRSQKHEE
ncbi:MAG: thioesterase family protein [Brumimicrobium sp.]|nr:thioesterase family protein [Brumimicrobium sp.]